MNGFFFYLAAMWIFLVHEGPSGVCLADALIEYLLKVGAA